MSKWVTAKGTKKPETKRSKKSNPDSSKFYKIRQIAKFQVLFTFSRQSRFIKSLPPSISKDKEFCANLHQIFVDKTSENIKENFANVEAQVKICSKLTQLQNVVSDENNKATEYSKAWRPLDSALDNQAAHDRKSVLEAKHRLQSEVLKPLQSEVNDLEKRVADLSYQVAENASKINSIIFHQDS